MPVACFIKFELETWVGVVVACNTSGRAETRNYPEQDSSPDCLKGRVRDPVSIHNMECDKEDTQGNLRTHIIICVYTIHTDIHTKL